MQNYFLAALPAAIYARLLPDLELTSLEPGAVIYESDTPQEYVYFPTTSSVSLLSVLPDGSVAEIAVVGNEGVIGIASFLGGESTPRRAVVQGAGQSYRLNRGLLKDEFERGGPLRILLQCYSQALTALMAQTPTCNRRDTIEQQLCRWLLLSMDRLSTRGLALTRQQFPIRLGVRRENVTAAAGTWQADRAIEYSRGRTTVLDPRGRPGSAGAMRW